MSKDFLHLHHWLMGWPGQDAARHEPRAVILECIVSRSGMSMAVYDRGERLYAINGYGFDRLGCALAEFLERCFQPELCRAFNANGILASRYRSGTVDEHVFLDGACGFSSMAEIAQAIGLKVHQSESKAGTLIIIEKGD